VVTWQSSGRNRACMGLYPLHSVDGSLSDGVTHGVTRRLRLGDDGHPRSGGSMHVMKTMKSKLLRTIAAEERRQRREDRREERRRRKELHRRAGLR
jgi:hypothetical protein